ncbi:uncharacterized protein Z519_05290 [Cladophialophora bantiana CBS 173.52]|uniref:Uncharacterized protein n=1 Tax=Cladophialophora bantiana (strain ATCC 10958 / CBS 173.52 / CDC B-1940 / NIH 8579) TaxID=1442370 RepID=A0A0D2HSZ6_CLAB1|nr:uncharacterized protein Z519_05290 [Cladophialophora bantiana CBS 173.52]KIW93975.1 hypothetical protein Z519_05290 [Cladophialophora bantiana CBS 173.52]
MDDSEKRGPVQAHGAMPTRPGRRWDVSNGPNRSEASAGTYLPKTTPHDRKNVTIITPMLRRKHASQENLLLARTTTPRLKETTRLTESEIDTLIYAGLQTFLLINQSATLPIVETTSQVSTPSTAQAPAEGTTTEGITTQEPKPVKRVLNLQAVHLILGQPESVFRKQCSDDTTSMVGHQELRILQYNVQKSRDVVFARLFQDQWIRESDVPAI